MGFGFGLRMPCHAISQDGTSKGFPARMTILVDVLNSA